METITGKISLQLIFFLYWDAFCIWYKGNIRSTVYENVEKILKCRTPQLGYHIYQCPSCQEIRLIPHTCKSRFCSSCGKIATDKWTAERLSDILPVGYHHLVFTLPWQLRSICRLNRKVMLQLLFTAVSVSIQTWTKEYGGYIPGFYVVLHTFGSDLKFNPHFHVLITAGGLSLDHKIWVNAPDDFLMPERGLKKRWKYNVTKGIISANKRGLLVMPFLPKKKQYLNLRGVISAISKLAWYVFIGIRLNEIGLSIKYVGRYTKKPVIAETRIISFSSRWIVFKFKDYANGGKISSRKMGLFTFIAYLIEHIPDKYFRNVRGYGIFSNRLKGELLPKVRNSLNQPEKKKKNQGQKTWRELHTERTGKDPLICENCFVEMKLVFICFSISNTWCYKLDIGPFERIPAKQFQYEKW